MPRSLVIIALMTNLKNFDPNDMNEEDALSYKVLKYDAEMQLEEEKYDTWKIPFTQMGDATNTLSGNIVLAMGQYGSGESSQPFKTVTDYHNWLQRVHGYAIWCDSAIQNFRQGMATKYVLPKTLVVKMIDICNGLVSADETKSIFYGPIKKLPGNFTGAEKDSLTAAYNKFLVKDWTTTSKTLDEIYNTGLSEVKRIHDEMENIKSSTGFKGDLN